MKTIFLLIILTLVASCNQNHAEKTSVENIDLSHTVDKDRQRAINSVKKSFKTPRINFSGGGNEPGWSVSVNSTQIEILMNYGKDTITDGYQIQEIFNSYRINLPNNPTIQLTLVKEKCFDDMSGKKYNTSIKMVWKERIFYGCGNF